MEKRIYTTEILDRVMQLDKATVTIVALTVLESVAMITGHDGAFFMPVVAIVSGLGGYKLGKIEKMPSL